MLEFSLVWVDLELTGLDYAKDEIVEIAVVVTDKRLSKSEDGPSLVIRKDPNSLSEWCQTTFAKNGLLQEMQESTLTVQEAEDQVMEFIQSKIPEKGVGHLAGSSVHVDRHFLFKEMPRIVEYLSHRIVDVSSFVVCCWAWAPQTMREYKGAHKYDTSDADAPAAEAATANKAPKKTSKGRQSGVPFTAIVSKLAALITGEATEEDAATEVPKITDTAAAPEAVPADNAAAPDAVPADAPAPDAPDAAPETESTKKQEASVNEEKKDYANHRAMDDIKASIELLKFIKTHLFKRPPILPGGPNVLNDASRRKGRN